MKRGMLIIGAALSLSLIGGLLATSGGAQQQAPTGTLRLVALHKEDRFNFVNNPPKQGMRQPPSPGDIGVLRHKLRNTSGERVGNARVIFTTTGRRGAIVYGVFKVGGDLITIEGISSGVSPTDTHAITGGTGVYNGAAGTLTVEGGRERVIFSFSFSG